MSSALEPLALSPREADAFLSISKRGLSRLIRATRLKAEVARASMVRHCCRRKPTISDRLWLARACSTTARSQIRH